MAYASNYEIQMEAQLLTLLNNEAPRLDVGVQETHYVKDICHLVRQHIGNPNRRYLCHIISETVSQEMCVMCEGKPIMNFNLFNTAHEMINLVQMVAARLLVDLGQSVHDGTEISYFTAIQIMCERVGLGEEVMLYYLDILAAMHRVTIDAIQNGLDYTTDEYVYNKLKSKLILIFADMDYEIDSIFHSYRKLA